MIDANLMHRSRLCSEREGAAVQDLLIAMKGLVIGAQDRAKAIRRVSSGCRSRARLLFDAMTMSAWDLGMHHVQSIRAATSQLKTIIGLIVVPTCLGEDTLRA